MKKNILNIILMSLSLILIVSVLISMSTFAWFRIRDFISPLDFQITKIDSEVWLFRGVDDNYNGIPNRLATPIDRITYQNNGITVEHEFYYDEWYDFDDGDTTDGDTFISHDYALSVDSDSIVSNIELPPLFPSQLFTFKMAMLNRSNAVNFLTFHYGSRDADPITYGNLTDENAILMATLYVRIGQVQSDGSVVFGEFHDFAQSLSVSNDVFTFTGLEILDDEDNRYELPGVLDSSLGKCDYWIQIGIAPYEWLVENTGFVTTLGLDRTDYDSVQGSSTLFPDLYVYFDIDNVDTADTAETTETAETVSG